MDRRKKIVISLFIFLMIFPFYVTASKSALSEEAQLCLGCHSDKNLTKQLENREILSLYINGDEFAKSAHNVLGCAGCHMDISMENHPQIKKISNKKEYSAIQSKTCTMCHVVEQAQKENFHTFMVTKVKSITCSECHGSHYIRKIAEWKKSISEAKYCLTCHKYEFSMTLSNGDILPLYIHEPSFKNSAHGGLGCTGCHQDFSINKHPFRTFKSRKEYVAETSKTCTMCHTNEQLRKNPAHAALITKDTCVGCHGSHNIQPIAAQKEKLGDTEYCLTCHRGRLTMTMRNGEKLSIYVDTSTLGSSVHGILKCTECHTNFSKTEHPARTFESIKEYSLISSELCRKCHADAYTKYETSIHYSLVKSGNFDAPTCNGCHGSGHSIAKATVDKSLGLTLCNKCHADMYSSYKASIHEKERIKGKKNTPTCASCHNAHDVQSMVTAAIKESCLSCHKDMASIHNKWLSNPPIKLTTFAELHFNSVDCAACHSPDAKRGIYLTLYNRKTGKPLTEAEVAHLLETDSAGLKEKLDKNGNGVIDSQEVWDIFKKLYAKGVWATFIGKMNVSSGDEAHRLAAKSEAARECELCHRPDSTFFKEVFIVISRTDGKPKVYEANRKVIGSFYSIVPMSKFYALGSSNVRLLDILFVIAIIGGLAVPIGHITLRIITSPLRSLRRMGKGGKK